MRWTVWAGVIWLQIGTSDRHVIEPSCSMKSGEILDQLSSCELVHMNAAENLYSIASLFIRQQSLALSLPPSYMDR
jgi:hypothetical protein